MRYYILKYLLLAALLLSLNHSLWAKIELKPNRFYTEIGLHGGTMALFNKKQNNNSNIYGSNQNTALQPTGFVLSTVAGNKNYQLKARLCYSSPNVFSGDWLEVGALFGKVLHERNVAIDFNIGLAYQRLSYQVDLHPYTIANRSTIGFISELNLQATTPYAGIAPSVFFNINAIGLNYGFGLKLMLGKVAYTKKQFTTLTQNQSILIPSSAKN